jgi:O-acetyl-ADP-ribose deacetylase
LFPVFQTQKTMSPTTKSFIRLLQGDITKRTVDAIVNAANSSLMGGGGVDGAIHRAGGPAILEDCKEIVRIQGGCPTGDAVITTGGNLPARYVIHTVGPVWYGGTRGEGDLLQNAYENSLKLAEEHQLTSIAFPNISTGVYRFPKKLAAVTAVATVRKFLKKAEYVKEIVFVCYDEENYHIYKQLVDK